MPITTEPKGPKPNVPQTAKVVIQYQNTTDPARRAANIFHVTGIPASGLTDLMLNTFATSFSSNWATALAGVLGTTWQIISCEVVMIDGSGLIGADITVHTGTASTAAMPPNCAVVVSWKATQVTWRGGRPRTYIPGVTAGALSHADDSAISNTFAAALVSQMKAFINNIDATTVNGSTVALCAVSYFSKGAFRSPPLVVQFFAPQVHQRVASQRRRSGKEGLFLTSS